MSIQQLKNRKCLLGLISFLLLINFSLQAADNKKFGKVSLAEVQQKECAYYPDADAEYLISNGHLRILGGSADYFVHKRIKVYTDEGKNEATIKIKYYEPISTQGDNIRSLRANCYNIKNGELVKTKLSAADKFDERINDYFKEITFVVPNVKKGSVFEYSYVRNTEYLRTLPPWQIQYDIPVAFTEFNYDIDADFLYKIYITGNVYNLESGKKAKDNWGFDSQRGTLNSEKVLPMPEEPYQPNADDVLGKINFQLIKYFPTQKDFSSDYETLAKDLMKRDRFGRLLNRKGILKALNLTIDTPTKENAELIYNYIQSKTAPSQFRTLTSKVFGKKLLSKVIGSVTDINLTFVAALNEAGYDAHPVLLSTQGNGIPHPIFADIARFDYVIASVKIKDKWITCDASSNLPFGILPTHCLNAQGRVINKLGGEWLDLKKGKNANNAIVINANIEDNTYTEEVNIRWTGYEAYNDISQIEENGMDEFKEFLKEEFGDEIEDINVEHNGMDEPINITFKYVEDITGANPFYINPVKYGAQVENPFQRDLRFSNVNIPYAFKDIVVYKLTYSDKWTFESPENKKVQMQDKKCSMSYGTEIKDGSIQVISDLRFMETDFLADEYDMLKSFLDAATSLNNEVIIGKKAP